ncbi:hypothetical protein [Arthrobacter alpinus]|uniref:hypothetical protein n=1 Tax=Arthrobacter alpinus TaxID=656366 RepID=UPI00192D0E93|nr:hypothetical protein [Arthrobacter alpinus]
MDSERRPKPAGLRLAKLIASERANPTAPLHRSTALSFDPGDEATGMGRSVADPSGELFTAWLARAASGTKPALVRASKTSDADYLAARGITDVVN